MQADAKTPAYLSVRFADGHRMWLASTSPTEVVLHPVFLRYLAACLLLVSMLDRGGSEVGLEHGGQIALLWLVLGAQALVWFGAASYLTRYLALKGVISSLFTPLIVMPNLVFIHLITNWIVVLFGNQPSPDLETLVSIAIRDIVILIIFDVMFSCYVARQHPAFSETPVDLAAPTPQAVDDSATPEAMAMAQPSQDAADIQVPHETPDPAPAKAVRSGFHIGAHSFNPSRIVALRSEGHHVRVQTTTGEHLVRARFSQAVAKLDPLSGVQIHRSAWVAFAAVSALTKTDGTMTLVMQDGTEETVAVTRQHAVRFAYESYCQTRRARKR